MNEKCVDIMKINVDRSGGKLGVVSEIHDLMFASLSQGASTLDELIDRSATELLVAINELASGGRPHTFRLLEWTQKVYAASTASLLFGKHNPIAREPSLAIDFWTWDRNLGSLLFLPLPRITTPEVYEARERLVAGFRDYVSAKRYDGVDGAAEIIRKRIETVQRHGFDVDGIAREEMSFLFAAITNTAITSFWLVLRICSDPHLLQVIRDEITAISQKADSIRREAIVLNVDRLTNECPLLLSTYRETLRTISDISSNRLVTEDTMLCSKDGHTYRLRKGSLLQISGGAMHSNPALWSSNPDDFEPRRFLQDKSAQNKTAFRAFGGGSTLCPGRHLAAAEVLLWTAAIVQGFDVSFEGAKGTAFKIPSKCGDRLPVHVCEPAEDVIATMRPRVQSINFSRGQKRPRIISKPGEELLGGLQD